MSIVGILASNFFSAKATQNTANATQSNPITPSKFQQIKTEFEQLGQDLQSGDLTQAKSDFAALSQNFLGAAQSTATITNTAATGNNSVAQAFTQLGQDLQSGNLQAAQKDFTNLQQDLQQDASQQVGEHHHRHHHVENSQPSSSSSSQQANPIVQAFSTLAQDLQAGNLSGAQSAFATLQNDLRQIGGVLPAGSKGTFSTAAPSGTGSLNVTA
jgi:outer membrane protein assembly factor BamD (BamD/ComL family)